MKVWFRCNKCGESFEAEERVRTDICPRCMSFVDLARAEKLADKPSESEKAAAPAFPSSEDGAQSSSAAPFSAAKAQETVQQRPHSPQESVSPPRNAPTAKSAEPSAFGAEDTYDSLYSEAEKMLTFGAWGNAAELFRHCLAKRECWQARFGLVRASTRELTDLSNFSAVQKDADAAFDKMTAAERLSLGKRYVPKLDEKRRSLCRSLKVLEEQEHFTAASKGENGILSTSEGGLKNVRGGQNKGGKGLAAIIVCTLIMVIFFIIGAAIMSEEPGGGTVILLAGIAVGIPGIVFGALANSKEKRVRAAWQSVQIVAENSRQAERAKLKVQLDAIDYLCGFLKY